MNRKWDFSRRYISSMSYLHSRLYAASDAPSSMRRSVRLVLGVFFFGFRHKHYLYSLQQRRLDDTQGVLHLYSEQLERRGPS